MKCKELAEELGVSAMEVGRVRAKLNLPKGDIDEHGAEAIRGYYNPTEEEEDFGPKFCWGVVTFAQEGSRQIEVTLADTFERVRAFVPLDFNAQNLWLQRIKLEYIDYENERHYRHAALTAKTWQALSPFLKGI